MNTVFRFQWFSRFFFILGLGLVASCGGKNATPFSGSCLSGTSDCPAIVNKFVGTWRMTHVACDGSESPVLTDAGLQSDSEKITTVYQGGTGNRQFVISACSVTIPYISVVYGDTFVTITEGQPICNGDCAAFSGPCSAPASSVTYPYQNNGSVLTFTVPQTLNAQDPCNSNWAKTVQVVYTKID